MAKPDLENGYLLIAHELFAAMFCAGFTKWEQVVIREVLSQIFGPRKSKTATFSPTEIARQVSTHKESIVRATRTLIASNVLAKVGDMEYRFLKDYEAWTRDGEPRLSSFERAYCESAKTINVSNKRGNNGAPHPSTKGGNNGAPISTEQGNNGAPDGNTGAPHGEHGRSRTGTRALPTVSRPPDPPIEEPARGIEKGEEERERADTRTPTEFESGRKGLEHSKFIDAWKILKAYPPTAHLARGLIMAADTPEVRGFEAWRIWVGAVICQRPNKSKEWGSFLGFCRNATEDEHRRLQNKREAAKAETPIEYFIGSKKLLGPPGVTK